jgi:hypothetical protein
VGVLNHDQQGQLLRRRLERADEQASDVVGPYLPLQLADELTLR